VLDSPPSGGIVLQIYDVPELIHRELLRRNQRRQNDKSSWVRIAVVAVGCSEVRAEYAKVGRAQCVTWPM
jgi:hypothetical protein